MKMARIALALLICSGRVLLAEAGPGLGQFFSTEENPGSGTLITKKGKTGESIQFGTIGGHYGMGVIFRGSFLPAPYSKDFQDSRIIQIALGTLKGKLQGQVPQFASATIIASEIPTERRTFPLVVPTGKGKMMKEMALLLFTAPGTPTEQSDEEKLKGTYFAESGTVTVIPMALPKKVQIKSQGKTLSFDMVPMQLQFDAKLVTPFNTEETLLQGSIEFPVYWPIGKDAKALTRRIATDSLGTAPSLPPAQEGLTTHKRGVAGSTKEDRN